MNCIIREYNKQDYNGLSKLLNTTYGSTIGETELLQHYISKTKRIIVAIDDETKELTGCAFAEEQIDYIRPNKVLYVTYVAVDEQFQGRGIGRQIMNYIEVIGKETRCNAIEFTSADFRTGAHAFYNRLGFSQKKTTHFIKEYI